MIKKNLKRKKKQLRKDQVYTIYVKLLYLKRFEKIYIYTYFFFLKIYSNNKGLELNAPNTF